MPSQVESYLQLLNALNIDSSKNVPLRYKRASLRAHPNKPGGSHEKFLEITKAYRYLQDHASNVNSYLKQRRHSPVKPQAKAKANSPFRPQAKAKANSPFRPQAKARTPPRPQSPRTRNVFQAWVLRIKIPVSYDWAALLPLPLQMPGEVFTRTYNSRSEKVRATREYIYMFDTEANAVVAQKLFKKLNKGKGARTSVAHSHLSFM